MIFSFISDIEAELEEIEKSFQLSLLPWWDNLHDYYIGLNDDMTFKLLPALSLAASKYMGLKHTAAIALANIMKTFYFSSIIHEQVKDDAEGQIRDQNLQFSILIGDYILGRVLKLMVEAGMDRILNLFADMMCEVNEGLVKKHKLDASLIEQIAKTRAPIYEVAFVAASVLTGTDATAGKFYKELGKNLGMAVELLQANQLNEAHLYINRSWELMPLINRKSQPGLNVLERAVRDLDGRFYNLNELAAI